MRLTNSSFINKGLEVLNGVNEFTYSLDAYGQPKNFTKEIEDKGFVKTSHRFVGRDFEIFEQDFRRKTQSEIDSQNLELQIKNLETRFKIKINYTKNEN
jgi:hypothetical protein